MKTSETEVTPASPTRLRKLRFAPNRRGWVVLAATAVTLSSIAADTGTSLGRVQSRVRVGSLDLGGKRFDDAEKLLVDRARVISSEPALFTEASTRLEVDPADVGFFPDVDATLERAKGVGRSGIVFRRFWERLRSYFRETDVGWSSTVDRAAADSVMESWAERFDSDGNEAGIEVKGDRLVAVQPVPGRKLDQARARRTLVAGLEQWPRRPLDLPFRIEDLRTGPEDAAEAVRRANAMIGAPITLTSPSGSVELEPADLAPLLEAVPIRAGEAWTLQVRFSAEKVDELIGPKMAPFETEPQDASFAVSGSRVSVRASSDGYRFDAETTADALDKVAGSEPPRTTEAAFSPQPPRLTTEQAEALKITELVSTFTTNHASGQPRVRNIHTMARAVDGMIVRPGETFSLNQRVGQRTTDKGYVEAPMIYDGEFRDDIGGGVSQFATTMYNAIFFGGYEIVSAKAHSYYISRYPAGREATISFPAPDLKFRNNSGAGILVKTSFSNSSITVSFYGDKEGKNVTAESGERTNYTDPPEKREPNPAMEPGTERVKQRGSRGFDIVVWRVITKDGKVSRERIFTRYKPEPMIVEFGPGTPAPSPPPEEPEPTVPPGGNPPPSTPPPGQSPPPGP